MAEQAVRQIPNLRPEMRNAILALSGMPPAARERQIESGLYASFSSHDRQILKAAVFTPAPGQSSAPARATEQAQAAQPRSEVRNAIRTLRAMPPAARQRQIESGAYNSFTPAEREMLRTVAQVQPGM